MATHEEGVTWPTAALMRAVLVVLVAGVAGVLLHRVDLAVVVTPFVVWLAWAALTRHRLDGLRGSYGTSGLQLREGEKARLHVQVDAASRDGAAASDPGDVVVGAVVDPVRGARLSPANGAFAGTRPDELWFEFQPDLWGAHRIGAARVVVGDSSGAWRRISSTSPLSVRVRPAAPTLVGSSGVARPIGISGIHRSPRKGPGTDVAEVREFVVGDRLRRVNWKVTSRTGRLHVTDTFVERDTDVLVVVDTLLEVTGVPQPDGSTSPSSLDASMRAASAITQHYVAFGDRIAVHDLGHRVGDVPSGTGPRQTKVLLDRLSRADRAAADDGRLRPTPRLTSGTLVFACTPLLQDAVLAELSRLRRLGAELVVIDTLPTDLGRSPLPGRDPDFLTEAWALRRLQHDATVDALRATGVPVTEWQGPSSLATVLLAMQAARSAPRLGGVR